MNPDAPSRKQAGNIIAQIYVGTLQQRPNATIFKFSGYQYGVRTVI
jgi:hypothetical protein